MICSFSHIYKSIKSEIKNFNFTWNNAQVLINNLESQVPGTRKGVPSQMRNESTGVIKEEYSLLQFCILFIHQSFKAYLMHLKLKYIYYDIPIDMYQKLLLLLLLQPYPLLTQPLLYTECLR